MFKRRAWNNRYPGGDELSWKAVWEGVGEVLANGFWSKHKKKNLIKYYGTTISISHHNFHLSAFTNLAVAEVLAGLPNLLSLRFIGKVFFLPCNDFYKYVSDSRFHKQKLSLKKKSTSVTLFEDKVTRSSNLWNIVESLVYQRCAENR